MFARFDKLLRPQQPDKIEKPNVQIFRQFGQRRAASQDQCPYSKLGRKERFKIAAIRQI